ncbi:unnamed protein product, partial [Polarella glacialis]
DFAKYLNSPPGSARRQVLSFDCPGSGRTFIAPRGDSEPLHPKGRDYEDTARFLRSVFVPDSQKDALWQELGKQVARALAQGEAGPLWVTNERLTCDSQSPACTALIVSSDSSCVTWMPYRPDATYGRALGGA